MTPVAATTRIAILAVAITAAALLAPLVGGAAMAQAGPGPSQNDLSQNDPSQNDPSQNGQAQGGQPQTGKDGSPGPNDRGQDDRDCVEAAGSVTPDFALPHVAEAIALRRLYIAVVGSASSDLTGPRGTNIAYPAVLERTLRGSLDGVDVKVATHARPRATAADMDAILQEVLRQGAPALVIWQTGTADAIKGVDPDDFRTALEGGVDRVRTAHADVVFVNMQYSPRIEAMLAVSAYADTMRMVAVQHQVDLFDRFDIMKRWNEDGVFDLGGATRTTGIAERVHGCLGRLLATVVVEGARKASPP